jgi:hypothetical protein
MVKKIKILVISSFSIAIALNLGWFIFDSISKLHCKKIYEKNKDKPLIYVYNMFGGNLRSALYIKYIEDRKLLKNYYDDLEMGKPSYILVQMRYLPYNSPMFLIGKCKEDSTIYEIIDINTRTWEYTRGFVYSKTVFNNPPPDSLLIKLEKIYSKRNQNY